MLSLEELSSRSQLNRCNNFSKIKTPSPPPYSQNSKSLSQNCLSATSGKKLSQNGMRKKKGHAGN